MIVRHHHESFDGSGYPDGLAGNDIPQICRILLVVDSYDAMTTVRPHRMARSHGDAMDVLAEEAGRKLDPEVVAVFSKVIVNSPVRTF